MLQKLASHISDCLARAADADRRADGISDPTMRSDYRQMANGWRHLAASYQFSESLERFILDAERAKKAEPTPPAAPQ